MNKKYWIVIGGLLAALLVVGAVGATAVYAQGPNPPAFGRMGLGHAPGEGRGLGQAELEAAAKVLGMTSDELSSALQGGKTLQELADEAGVAIEDVHAAIQSVHEAEMRERIAQAVEDGTMTQEKADWLLTGLDKGFMGGGMGRGLGGPRGGGMGNCPMGQPQAQNNP